MEMKVGNEQMQVADAPQGWPLNRMGSVLRFQVGFPFSSAFFNEVGVGIRLVKNRDLKNDDQVFHYTGPYDPTYLVVDGDVLVGMDGDFLPCLWGKGQALLNQRVGRILPLRGLDRVFAYYFLMKPLKELEAATSSTTVKHLSHGNIESIEKRLPPEPEQRAIAAALSDVDQLLAGLDRLIAKKRDLKQAAMQQLLTGQTRLPGFQGEWEIERLGELGTTYGGLTGKSKADFGTGAARYVTFMNVMTNTVIDHSKFEAVRVSPSESQNRVERGDLLFNGSSETPEEVALCAVVQRDVNDLYLNSFCFGYRPRTDADVDGLFLTYYIRSSQGREIMKSLAQGSTRYNLSKKALLAAEVRVPSLAEQLAISGTLSDMDAELTALEARRDKTRALKQGMMQELLTGRTRLV